MRPIRFAQATLIAVLILLPAGQSDARSRHAAATPGDFDFFLLSLSIAPAFCALSPHNQAKDECQSLTGQAFRQTPLTVHGLWPNRANVSVNRQPQDCAGPPLPPLPDAVQAELRRYMPGGPDLERYEWQKHGTCSGLSPQIYFAAITRLARHANETIGEAMRQNGMLGHNLRIVDLLAAVAARDPALAPAIVVDCKFARGGGGAVVDEIRVALSKDFTPVPAVSVGMGQNSGCPQGQGLVPSVSG